MYKLNLLKKSVFRQVRVEQLAETAAILRGRTGDRKAWVSAILAANWAAATQAREAPRAALPASLRGRADPDSALYAEPQVCIDEAAAHWSGGRQSAEVHVLCLLATLRAEETTVIPAACTGQAQSWPPATP